MANKRHDEFELRFLPHLGAAYSLARWMLRHRQDAEDAVQEAMLRALKAHPGQSGPSGLAWLLAIVRNTCLTHIDKRRASRNVVPIEDLMVAGGGERRAFTAARDPTAPADELLIADEERRRVHRCIAALPIQFREVIVLRELHDLSYREIAEVTGTPVGTVMSRLARGRERLKALLGEEAGGWRGSAESDSKERS